MVLIRRQATAFAPCRPAGSGRVRSAPRRASAPAAGRTRSGPFSTRVTRRAWSRAVIASVVMPGAGIVRLPAAQMAQSARIDRCLEFRAPCRDAREERRRGRQRASESGESRVLDEDTVRDCSFDGRDEIRGQSARVGEERTSRRAVGRHAHESFDDRDDFGLGQGRHVDTPERPRRPQPRDRVVARVRTRRTQHDVRARIEHCVPSLGGRVGGQPIRVVDDDDIRRVPRPGGDRVQHRAIGRSAAAWRRRVGRPTRQHRAAR